MIVPRSIHLVANGKARVMKTIWFSSIQLLSCPTLWPHGLQHTKLLCPLPTPRACSYSCPASQWCHPISSSVVPFSSCLQSFQHQGLCQWISSLHQVAKMLEFQLSASVLPVNVQVWFPLGWTGLISLQSKGLSRFFSNTTVQKHQLLWHSAFYLAQLLHPYMTTGKTIALTR